AGGYASRADIARFQAEAEAVARLQHPNIVQVFEIGQINNLPYFTLEYVGGGTLADRVADNPLPPDDAAELVEQLARAVQYAHDQGVIRRDLKPANILLVEGGGWRVEGKNKAVSSPSSLHPSPVTLHPKIADFGLAKRADATDGPTQNGAVMGTPGYMAPEQA